MLSSILLGLCAYLDPVSFVMVKDAHTAKWAILPFELCSLYKFCLVHCSNNTKCMIHLILIYILLLVLEEPSVNSCSIMKKCVGDILLN